MLFCSLALTWTSALAAPPPAQGAQGAQGARPATTAIRAGTVHRVGAEPLTGGVTVLVRAGAIVAVGKDVVVPLDAHVVDYGPHSVVVPGLVAPLSPYGLGAPTDRTANAGVRAVDNFDYYDVHASALSGGVTSAYLTPSRNRLIAGQGALVKLAGDGIERRTLRAPASVHGTITPAARSAGAYWEPPIPPTVDVGMNNSVPQLPASTMGAIVALREIVAGVKRGESLEESYGPLLAKDLAPLVKERLPWCIEADSRGEIAAVLYLAREEQLPLVIHGGLESGPMAADIAQAGARVVYEVPYRSGTGGVDRGKGEGDAWPAYDAFAALLEAGVPVAIACEGSPRDLRFAAALASRGGVSTDATLRAITLTPAELYGVAARVGSIAPGKDADLVVLNGEPFATTSTVVATWVDGELAWHAHSDDHATVLEVDELYVGDGEILAPGQVLMQGGVIREVGRSVSHPLGATIVRGRAAMPGIVDALGHLGLEGSTRVPATDFDMTSILAPGDDVDRRVARRGITTVNLAPRGYSRSGAPITAYKPAEDEFGELVVEKRNAIRLRWYDRNRQETGKEVQKLLERAVEYRQKWEQYERELAAWEPPVPIPPRPKANVPKEEDKEKKDGKGDEEEEKKGDDKDEEEGAQEDTDPLTGTWTASIERTPGDAVTAVRIQLSNAGGVVRGSVRADALSDRLIPVEGTFADGKLSVSGLTDRGRLELEATVETKGGDEKKKKKKKKGEDEAGDEEKTVMQATARRGALEIEFQAERQSREYVVAKLPETPPGAESPPAADEGDKKKPEPPKIDEDLEPLRRAMQGRATVIVEVERDDEILACVDAFEKAGIEPVLLGASGARYVLDRLVGRVAGVLPDHAILRAEAKKGTDYANVWAELQNAGVPVAFYSAAEEGAIDLPVIAAYAVSQGMSPAGALRALTSDSAALMSIGEHVGRLAVGLDADVLLLDGAPLDPSTRILRTWVNGQEIAR